MTRNLRRSIYRRTRCSSFTVNYRAFGKLKSRAKKNQAALVSAADMSTTIREKNSIGFLFIMSAY